MIKASRKEDRHICLSSFFNSEANDRLSRVNKGNGQGQNVPANIS